MSQLNVLLNISGNNRIIMEDKVSTEMVNFYVKVNKSNNISAKQTYDMFVNACGVDNIVLYSQIKKIAAETHGDENFSQKRGSGRPETNDENVALVKALIDDDDSISIRRISESIGIAKTTVETILKTKLYLKSVVAKWIPYNSCPEKRNANI